MMRVSYEEMISLQKEAVDTFNTFFDYFKARGLYFIISYNKDRGKFDLCINFDHSPYKKYNEFDKRKVTHEQSEPIQSLQTGTFCKFCGGIMMQAGSCEVCTNCGDTSSCG